MPLTLHDSICDRHSQQILTDVLLHVIQVRVQGDYGAKIDALLRRLIFLNEKWPDIKSLVRHLHLRLYLGAMMCVHGHIGLSCLQCMKSVKQ